MNLQSSAIVDNEEIFNDLRQRVMMQTQTRIKHQQIVLHVTDAIMLSLWENPGPGSDLDAWIRKQVDRQTEAYIEDLWHYTFAYAISMVNNPDNAQDIAQSTMMAFFDQSQKDKLCEGLAKTNRFQSGNAGLS